MVRAKFVVSELRQSRYMQHAKTVVLEPQYDTTVPEDKRFSDATPCGRMEMLVTNAAALEQLRLGKAFYIDLTLVED